MNFVENIPCIPRYHVTDTGEVYRKNGYTSKTGLIYNKPNKPLWCKCKLDVKNGYMYVHVRLPNFDKTIRVHRLVAEAYIPNPHNYPIVCHKDNNRTNNHVSNLYWGTQSMNIHQTITDGRNNPPIGNKNFYHGKRGTDTNNGKYSVRLKLRIYRFYKRHPLVTNKELRIKFGIKNRSTITKIISGRDMIIKEHYS